MKLSHSPVFIILCLISAYSFAECEHPDWKMTTVSTHIVIGELKAPDSSVIETAKSNNERFVDYSLYNPTYIKGENLGDNLTIRHYSFREPSRYYPKLDQIIQLNEKQVIAFLQLERDPEKSNSACDSEAPEFVMYFTRNTSCSVNRFSDKLRNVVSNEVKNQKEIAAKDLSLQFADAQIDKTVRSIIERMLNKDTAIDAYKEMESLGFKAVPYIIKHLNDTRELPVKRITLENKSPKAFEALRHYNVNNVIEVLSAILNQMTGSYFYYLKRGKTDRHQYEIAAWKIWLQHNIELVK